MTSVTDHDQPVAVVLGAARGIGAAVARALADSGSKVVAVDTAATVTDMAAQLPTRSNGVVGDAADPQVVTRALGVAAEMGQVRHLVHLAYLQAETTVDADDGQWPGIFDVGVRSAWMATAEFAAVAATPASIVLTSSNQAWRPHPRNGAYAAAKAAVQSITRSLAVELGPRGIRCNAVAPGYVAVERNAHRRDSPGAEAAHRRRNPLGRLVRPEDVAAAVIYLLGPGAAGITGVSLPVDAGETIYSLVAADQGAHE